MKGIKITLIVILSALVIGMTGMLAATIIEGGGGFQGFPVWSVGDTMKLYEKEEVSGEGIRTWKIHLNSPCYDVRILPGEGDKMVIEKWYSRQVSDRQKVKTDLKGDTLILGTEEGRVRFRWFGGGSWGYGKICIYLPKDGLKDLEGAEIDTAAGDVDVTGLHVPCSIETVSGDVVLDEMEGNISLESVSGDICVRHWKGYGFVKTISGDVEIRMLEPEGNISLDTISGDIEMRLAEGSEVEIKTDSVSGDEDISVPQTRGGHSLRVETLSGDIGIREAKKN